ncbi:hypothetical protein PanWU01x14_039750 [Parasponia andersonii]|uniref:Uncharacterized protein n=1 Tax=Parasponia andersonii TaxID=3476 RepID=A0A2P5DQZ2_PARAD|nr:hypothetical protein PanWU01x14_039750 [Parasponia andersonii]
MEIPSEFPHVSPSPSICSVEDSMNFYSAPTSPTSELSQTEPTTPTTTTTYEDCGANYNLDEFEFDKSRRFLQFDDLESVQEPETPTAHELPVMSFADELFCDGKVVPLALPPQLKLPPRLCGGNNNFGGQSIGAAVSSSLPRTPLQSVLKLPFPRQCLWNDDFDPFTVAIENVTEGKRGKNHRRARSLSPLRARPSESVRPVLENGLQSNGLRQPNWSASMRWASPKEATRGEWAGPMQETGFKSNEKRPLNGSAPPGREGSSSKLLAELKGVVIARRMQEMGFKSNEKRQLNGSASPKREWKSAKGLAEPKGVVIARQVRLAKLGPEKPSEPNKIPAQRPTAQTGNTPRGSGEPYTREIKRQRQKIMRRLLFKGESSKKVSDEDVDKVKYQNAALSKPTFMSRLSFKSINKTQYNEDKRVVSQVAKMTIVQYRPRLSLCLGYGSKYVQ